ncbi:hypothetical protein LINGRAPRIM_LOCUS823 [Linum grandiflorum]
MLAIFMSWKSSICLETASAVKSLQLLDLYLA